MSNLEMFISNWGVLLSFFAFFMFIFLYKHIIIGRLWGYRRGVIYSNIKSCFPEKTEKEHNTIVNSYYHHLCDLLVEPLLTFSSRAVNRVNFHDREIVEKLAKEGKDIVLFGSHYGNWEYMSMLPLFVSYEVIGAYTPVKNKMLNRFLMYVRGRNGLKLIPKDKYYKHIMKPREGNKPRLYLVMGDQSPARNSLKMSLPFLNHNTPVQIGAARIARKLKCAIVYLDVEKTKRYSYDYRFKVLSESVEELDDIAIMKLCYSELEKTILRRPDFWLWSHRRWKHEHVNI